MKIKALDHVNIETDDVDRSARFYHDVLGLEEGPRPEFREPGYWMYCGDRPIIHIIARNPNNKMLTGSEHAAISHFSMQIEDFDDARERLVDNGIEFKENFPPGVGLKQLFFADPDEVLVELLFIPEGGRV